MLQANKAQCITGFHLKSLDIRNLELGYYMMVFDKMSSISSLLGGFASSALMIGIPKKDNPILVAIFLFITSTAFGSHLLVMIISTMCTMWGPGKVLRASDMTAVNYAISILESYVATCARFFGLGLVCYFVSSLLVVWLLFELRGCIIISVVYVILVSWLCHKSLAIHNALNPHKVIYGRLKGNPVKNIGELFGDPKLTASDGITAAFATRI